MEQNYILLSEQQMEWIQRAVRQMMELTVYYGSLKQPLPDADYERIADMFSNQTRKSRGNGIVIRCAGVLSEYFDEIGSTPPKQPQLKKEELICVSRCVEEQFTLVQKWQGQLNSSEQLEDATRELEELCKKFSDCKLTHEFARVFQNYLSFCMEEKQRGYAAGRMLPEERETPGLAAEQEENREPMRVRQRHSR